MFTENFGQPLMRTVKLIISVILMVALFASGLPLFSPEDASGDGVINLRDAVLLTRNFAKSAENPANFAGSAKKMFAAMHVVAGLTENIKPGNDAKSTPIRQLFNLRQESPFLLASSCNIIPPTNNYLAVFEQSFHYQSIVISPSPPPPELVHVS